ncbi:MAG: hypothetical protein US03_C0010G0042 [candidate division TM6 bacterium GW2011_GWF2_36_131]|nr:MAG: hypothetical protein US03_C0010G0042 [candidate division TM6 bacterium GW2011_GWF2_36_131]
MANFNYLTLILFIHSTQYGMKYASTRSLDSTTSLYSFPDDKKQTPLEGAIERGLTEVVYELVSKNPTIVQEKNNRACRMTAQMNDMAIMKILLAYGANPLDKPKKGFSALELASSKEIKALLDDHLKKQNEKA